MDQPTSCEAAVARSCKVCGEVLVQRDGERNWNFNKRVTCGKTCANVATGRGTSKPRVAEERFCEICGDPIPYEGQELWRWRQRQTCHKTSCTNNRAIPRPVLEEKPCLHCGVMMHRGDQVLARFKAKKFCSYECSAEYRRAGLPTEKTCTVCGRTMQRRKKETASHWRARETCSSECRYAKTSASNATSRPAVMPPPKTCEVCGKEFWKRAEESHVTFAAKKACGLECAAVLISRARTVEWQPKPCQACGVLFEKRPEEAGKLFSKRRCCSVECQYDLMIRTRHNGQPSQSRYPRAWRESLKEMIRDRDGRRCQECGALEGDTAHHVHHIDYVRTNLSPTNLITLCAHCHGKTCNHRNKDKWITYYTEMMAAREGAAA